MCNLCAEVRFIGLGVLGGLLLWARLPESKTWRASQHEGMPLAVLWKPPWRRRLLLVGLAGALGALLLEPASLLVVLFGSRGLHLDPLAISAVAGSTNTGSVDQVVDLAALARSESLWLHVDAAYGGAAAVLPSHRQVLAGCEQADSIVVNPHKWLFTPIDCSVLFCRREDVLRRAFSIVPDYLSNPEGDSVRNLMDFGTSLGRRFRGLKLWFVLRAFGLERARAFDWRKVARATVEVYREAAA